MCRADRVRELYNRRQNYCYTSSIYREKVRIIDQKLARRFGDDPAVILWHISNEMGGDCHCALCQAEFRPLAAGTVRNAGGAEQGMERPLLEP